jgi:hypothetical protein
VIRTTDGIGIETAEIIAEVVTTRTVETLMDAIAETGATDEARLPLEVAGTRPSTGAVGATPEALLPVAALPGLRAEIMMAQVLTQLHPTALQTLLDGETMGLA